MWIIGLHRMSLTTRLENYIEGILFELQREDQDEMLIQIGNSDSYLRDELIYQSFGRLIFSHQLDAIELNKF